MKIHSEIYDKILLLISATLGMKINIYHTVYYFKGFFVVN